MEQNEAAVPPDKTLCIHPALWAIELNIQREPFQVIQFRGSIRSTKEAKNALTVIREGNNKGAEPPWSGKELEIHGVSRGQLAVVVGVVVPEGFQNTVKPKKIRKAQAFNRDEHTTISGNESLNLFYVVRPLKNEQRNTPYVLYEYSSEDGLCEIMPLSSALESCVLFFEEWVYDYAHTETKKRHDKIAGNITAFVQKYLKDHESDFTDTGLASTWSKKELQGSTKPPAQPLATFQSSIHGSLSAYEITGDNAPEDCDEDKDARSLVKLVKEAWFPTEKYSPDWLQPAVVKRLIIGLKDGALTAMNYDTPPAMWRSFIVHACSALADAPMDDAILTAARIRRAHRTIRQAGIGHNDYGNYRQLLGDDQAVSKIYNAAISGLKSAVEQANVDREFLRSQFPVTTSRDRSIEDIVSSLVDRSVSRDQRISDVQHLSALICAQHEMMSLNQSRVIEAAIKIMEKARDMVGCDRMEGIEHAGTEMHDAQMEGVEKDDAQMEDVEKDDAQTKGTKSIDEDSRMTEAEVELALERQLYG
ncbi:unnamed protein product [Fusarium fujikuroi]|nr:unnamed protein product [Fusarium fujikuroi]VZH88024.1 unnamed protein product [Fusarium fujikuroi]